MKYIFYFVIIPGLIASAFLWGRLHEMTRQKMQPCISAMSTAVPAPSAKAREYKLGLIKALFICPLLCFEYPEHAFNLPSMMILNNNCFVYYIY